MPDSNEPILLLCVRLVNIDIINAISTRGIEVAADQRQSSDKKEKESYEVNPSIGPYDSGTEQLSSYTGRRFEAKSTIGS
jgi:hypothetical protein